MQNLEHALQGLPPVIVVEGIRTQADVVPLDLSVNNEFIPSFKLPNFQNYIDSQINSYNAKAAVGGYNERRNLYRESQIFTDDEVDQERDIHIGIDIWIKAGTRILAALEGTVHSFDYNAGKGNYGPTIILKHQLSNIVFYTLYGHLSAESIDEIEIGDAYKQGQVLATLGDPTVNGGYPPHLHFQIIKNIDEYFGDYPGVCNINDLEYYLENCPDPNLLLKLKQ
ncbi:MAG TPA: peptidoglycan DD-metalloendopeptidase family protein [Flavobacterium sp.]